MERTLQNRSERYDLNIPIEYLQEGRIVLGRCINISESGLLARFDEPLDLWTTGELRLHAGQRSCKLGARVVRVTQREAGLTFSRRSDELSENHSGLIESFIEEARQTYGTFSPPF